MAGANLTFALLMVAVALGVSLAVPRGLVLRFLLVAGGALLLWLAADGFRSADRVEADHEVRRSLPPSVRGALAVVLNPGAWLFLAAVASPLFASAALTGGRGGSLLVAGGLALGLAIGDGAIVLVGGLGVRRARARAGVWVRRGLAVVLAALGVWLLVRGLLVET